MKILNVIIASSLLISCSNKEMRKETSLQTEVETGIIEGVLTEDGTVVKYLGVPYAKPPVGDLRWKAPQKPEPWEGILETKKYGHIPMQYKFAPWVHFDEKNLSEDCLYLNIWRPSRSYDHKLPVLFNIHGGGHVVGSGSDTRLEGTSMAQKGIIVVTMNYRLNIFGFFAHPELSKESQYGSSGNYGLLDQQMALQWVRDNISNFGGDPNRITIAGESAGSESVLSLLCSPLSKDIIAGAIGSSGGAMRLPGIQETEANGLRMAEKGGYSSLQQLRDASTEEIMTLYKNNGSQYFGLIRDKYALTENFQDVLKANKQANVPVLLGWNSEELSGEALMQGAPFTKEVFENIVKGLAPANWNEILDLYPHETEEQIRHSASELVSIDFIVYDSFKWFELHRKYSKQPIYRYLFSKIEPLPATQSQDVQDVKRPLGARHSQELAYCWGNLHLFPDINYGEDDKKVSVLMQDYFANFIKTGNPNANGLPQWPKVTSDNNPPVILNIDVESELTEATNDHRIKYFDKIYNNK